MIRLQLSANSTRYRHFRSVSGTRRISRRRLSDRSGES